VLHTTWPRFAGSFLVAYLVASNLNWGIAEVLFNPWAQPRLDGFLREGEDAGGVNVLKLVIGFLIPQFIAILVAASLPRPAGWAARAVYAGLLVGIAAFFGTYTFISGWGDVKLGPLMGAAVADTSCLVVGCLIAGWLQRLGRQERREPRAGG